MTFRLFMTVFALAAIVGLSAVPRIERPSQVATGPLPTVMAVPPALRSY